MQCSTRCSNSCHVAQTMAGWSLWMFARSLCTSVPVQTQSFATARSLRSMYPRPVCVFSSVQRRPSTWSALRFTMYPHRGALARLSPTCMHGVCLFRRADSVRDGHTVARTLGPSPDVVFQRRWNPVGVLSDPSAWCERARPAGRRRPEQGAAGPGAGAGPV